MGAVKAKPEIQAGLAASVSARQNPEQPHKGQDPDIHSQKSQKNFQPGAGLFPGRSRSRRSVSTPKIHPAGNKAKADQRKKPRAEQGCQFSGQATRGRRKPVYIQPPKPQKAQGGDQKFRRF